MSTSVKWRNREVERQPWRAVVAVLATTGAVVGMVLAFVVLTVAIAVCTPLHPLFRLAGRNGFWKVEDSTLSFDAGFDSFRRRARALDEQREAPEGGSHKP